MRPPGTLLDEKGSSGTVLLLYAYQNKYLEITFYHVRRPVFYDTLISGRNIYPIEYWKMIA